MKNPEIKELFEQKISPFDANLILPEYFYVLQTKTFEGIKVELHYYNHEGLCYQADTHTFGDVEVSLITLKKNLILQILYDTYIAIIKQYSTLLKEIENSEGWYKYDTAAKFLLDKDINPEYLAFLEDYLSLKS